MAHQIRSRNNAEQSESITPAENFVIVIGKFFTRFDIEVTEKIVYNTNKCGLLAKEQYFLRKLRGWELTHACIIIPALYGRMYMQEGFY